MTDLSWERINSSMSVGHSNVLAFVDLVLCFPSSSVCEQGFSRMKYTKTDWRNQLNSSSLSAYSNAAYASCWRIQSNRFGSVVA